MSASFSRRPFAGIPLVFYAAAGYNVAGMLLFSHGFSNPLLEALDPQLFTLPGQLSILLWGLAYAAVARHHARVPALVAVFALEKLMYAALWLRWLLAHGAGLPRLAEQSASTALFFAVYGLGDLLFGLFFAWAVWRAVARAESPASSQA